MIANIAKGKLSSEAIEKIHEQVNASFNPVTYLAIDPGESCGVSGYDAKHYLQFMIVVHYEELGTFLDQFDNVKTCILEDYKVYPGKEKQHIYSDLKTPQVIGLVKDWARRKSLQVILQMASIKPTGYAWIGQKPLPKSNPRNHALDAHVHFMYWAIRTGKIPAKDLLRRSNSQ